MTATFCDACTKKISRTNSASIPASIPANIGVHGPFDLCAECAEKIVSIIRNHEWTSPTVMRDPNAA